MAKQILTFKVPLEQRFHAQYVRIPFSGCWIWTGQRMSRGYGVIVANGRPKRAHRLSWEMHNGIIPVGLLVCHKCDIPECVNPNHLFLGTTRDNWIDMINKGRWPQVRGEKQGNSKLTEENVRFIRSSHLSGVALAEMFSVNKTNISTIRKYKSWKHVI